MSGNAARNACGRGGGACGMQWVELAGAWRLFRRIGTMVYIYTISKAKCTPSGVAALVNLTVVSWGRLLCLCQSEVPHGPRRANDRPRQSHLQDATPPSGLEKPIMTPRISQPPRQSPPSRRCPVRETRLLEVSNSPNIGYRCAEGTASSLF